MHFITLFKAIRLTHILKEKMNKNAIKKGKEFLSFFSFYLLNYFCILKMFSPIERGFNKQINKVIAQN